MFPATVAAQDLVTSPRPLARPFEQTVAAAQISVPKGEPAVQATASSTALVEATSEVSGSPRPRPNPWAWSQSIQTSQQDAQQVAAANPPPETAPTKKEKKSKKGSVCGDPAIKGEKLARITSKVKGCGVAAPVRVTSIDGIRLSQPATIDCDTAIALKEWIRAGLRPAFGQREVVELMIAAHYICRPRNNVKGNKVSEHGRGKAIDIAGFVFADGTSWSVANDYNRQIRKAQKAACGIFGTTLGPGSDGYHEDHLHFDTANYRSGPYCR